MNKYSLSNQTNPLPLCYFRSRSFLWDVYYSKLIIEILNSIPFGAINVMRSFFYIIYSPFRTTDVGLQLYFSCSTVSSLESLEQVNLTVNFTECPDAYHPNLCQSLPYIALPARKKINMGKKIAETPGSAQEWELGSLVWTSFIQIVNYRIELGNLYTFHSDF